MPDYAQQIRPEDRWAIAAYIRALQLSQHARSLTFRDQRQQLESKR
jgi:mono/diheme cytochrome c family protein